ncbi:MAG: hypothetical protein U0X87_16690 [Anaerolineales bacterium]
MIFGYLCSMPIIQLFMKYTDMGIEQPSIFGSKALRWDEMYEVRNITTGNIVLVGFETKININPNLFVDTQRFFAELRSRIPETVFPNETQNPAGDHRSKAKRPLRTANWSLCYCHWLWFSWLGRIWLRLLSLVF